MCKIAGVHTFFITWHLKWPHAQFTKNSITRHSLFASFPKLVATSNVSFVALLSEMKCELEIFQNKTQKKLNHGSRFSGFVWPSLALCKGSFIDNVLYLGMTKFFSFFVNCCGMNSI